MSKNNSRISLHVGKGINETLNYAGYGRNEWKEDVKSFCELPIDKKWAYIALVEKEFLRVRQHQKDEKTDTTSLYQISLPIKLRAQIDEVVTETSFKEVKHLFFTVLAHQFINNKVFLRKIWREI